MGQRGKGEGQRTTGKSEKRGRGWGGLRFFCLSVGEILLQRRTKRTYKEEERKKEK